MIEFATSPSSRTQANKLEPENLSQGLQIALRDLERSEGDTTLPYIEISSHASIPSDFFHGTMLPAPQQQSVDRPGMELFHLAIVKRSEEAWALLYQQYEALVRSWVVRFGGAYLPFILEHEDTSALVNAAFAKFQQAFSAQKLASFQAPGQVLAYLKLCTKSVVIDALRAAYVRRIHISLEDLCEQGQEPDAEDGLPIGSGNPEEEVGNALTARGFWQVIFQELPEHERLLISLMFQHGWKPAQIASANPLLFPTVEDVYHAKRNILARLRRNRQVQMYCHLSYGEGIAPTARALDGPDRKAGSHGV